MRQYTENSPGCSTAKYTNVLARMQYTTQSWKPFLARSTVTDRIGTANGRIGTDTDNRSLSHSTQSPTHIECSSVFPSQETGTDTFSSSHAKFKQFFMFSTSFPMVAFSLVNLRNVFRSIASGVNTDASTWLHPSDLFRTYWQT